MNETVQASIQIAALAAAATLGGYCAYRAARPVCDLAEGFALGKVTEMRVKAAAKAAEKAAEKAAKAEAAAQPA